MIYYLLPAIGLLIIFLHYGYGTEKYNDFVQVTCTIIFTFFFILSIPYIFSFDDDLAITAATVDYEPIGSIDPKQWRQPSSIIDQNSRYERDTVPSQPNNNSANVDKMPVCGHCGDDLIETEYEKNPIFKWPARGRIIQSFLVNGNDGINIALPKGTQIKAAEAGKIIYAGEELKGYGKMVLIRHNNGFLTAYANNSKLIVKQFDKVERGQIIAISGQTGNAPQPMLHFEVRKNSTPVSPFEFMRKD
jgi:murein DD-endopeptidase MepM/ murein hydrolase activator NlpD